MAPSPVPNKGRSTQSRSSIANLTTIDYHESLLDQNRQLGVDELEHETMALRQTRRWINKRPNTSGSGRGTGKSTKKNPAVSRQDFEEFKALPIAVRRKYFSTLERLRFAQTSGNLEGDTDSNFIRSLTLSGGEAFHSRETLGQHSFVSPTPTVPSPTSPVHQTAAQLSPAQLHQNYLTREEQVALARSLRQSVILDAADEAIYKIGRRSSKHLMPPIPSPTPSSVRPSMEKQQPGASAKTKRPGVVDDAFYDSFRWLDEDDDLDLSLYLDDYHANLREALPTPSKEHRPSFRRHLSLTKIPFGRPSVSSVRPATKDSMSGPVSPTPTSATHPSHARRQSRALSLIGPRHVTQGPAASMQDPAAHYQDPEARLKLRVYLASPQKFDEAIEFGFPSNDVLSGKPNPGPQSRRQSHQPRMLSDDSTGLKTFLSDDRSSTYSEDISLPDSDTPKTPHSPERHAVKPRGIPDDDGPRSPRARDSYAQGPVSSREMTLRMTLTRPDLRACEEHIYGWQKGLHPQVGASAQPSPVGDELPPSATYFADNKPKQSLEQFFASLDEADPSPTDGGMVKRLWNRVRRN